MSEEEEIAAATSAIQRALSEHLPDVIVTDWVLIASGVRVTDGVTGGRLYTHIVSDEIAAHVAVGLSRMLFRAMDDNGALEP